MFCHMPGTVLVGFPLHMTCIWELAVLVKHCLFWLIVSTLQFVLGFAYCVKLFVVSMAFWDSTLLTHKCTCLMMTSLVSLIVVNSSIISAGMTYPFMPLMNSSFSLLFLLYLHSMVFILSLPIYCSAVSSYCLCSPQYYRESFIVKLFIFL